VAAIPKGFAFEAATQALAANWFARMIAAADPELLLGQRTWVGSIMQEIFTQISHILPG